MKKRAHNSAKTKEQEPKLTANYGNLSLADSLITPPSLAIPGFFLEALSVYILTHPFGGKT